MYLALACYNSSRSFYFFFFNDTATTEIYTLSLHDALPIPPRSAHSTFPGTTSPSTCLISARSEEHTSELQSHHDLVCRLLLEKKKQTHLHNNNNHKKNKTKSVSMQSLSHINAVTPEYT